MGQVSQIINILETVSFGRHFFQIAMTLRETMFLNAILTNSDVWYNLKKAEVEELEELDRSLLRKIFSTKISCPKEALFLESGALSIGTIIKSKRINYLHYLVKEEDKSMLSKFFHAQWNHEARNDWTCQIRSDLDDFGIPIDLEYIKSKSDFSFKKLVKVKAQEYELCEMNSNKGTKMEKTFHPKLEMQGYLLSKEITVEDSKRVFAYRNRMANFSENFRGVSDPKQCQLCFTHLDNQQMSFTCPMIKPKLCKEGDYEGIFRTKVPVETVKNLRIIDQIREENL